MGTVTIERARLEQWLKAIDMFAGEDRQKSLHEAGKEMLQALAARPVQEPTDVWFDKCFRSDPPAAPVPLTDEQIDTACAGSRH